jgi:hypothetical protein
MILGAIASYLWHVTLLLGTVRESRASSWEGNYGASCWHACRVRAQRHNLRDGLMAGQQPGPEGWQAPDGRRYPPSPHSQADASGSPVGASGGSQRENPEKASRSRFGEWVQTTQGIVSIIAGVVALIGGGTGVAIAAHHNSSPPSPNPTPSISITTSNPGPTSSSTTPSTTGVFTKSATSVQLTQALLPVQALGTGATVRSSGTNLSGVVALCGDPLPSGAQSPHMRRYRMARPGNTLKSSLSNGITRGMRLLS